MSEMWKTIEMQGFLIEIKYHIQRRRGMKEIQIAHPCAVVKKFPEPPVLMKHFVRQKRNIPLIEEDENKCSKLLTLYWEETEMIHEKAMVL